MNRTVAKKAALDTALVAKASQRADRLRKRLVGLKLATKSDQIVRAFIAIIETVLAAREGTS